MKKWCALLLLLCLPVLAQAAPKTRTKWTDVPELLRPGKSERLVFDCPVETTATITVLDESGAVTATLWQDHPTQTGENTLYWDGTADGAPAAPGSYALHIALSGKETQTSLQVGEPAPLLHNADGDAVFAPGWTLAVDCSTAGEIVMTADGTEVLRETVPAGESLLDWDGTASGEPLPAGLYELEIRLLDITGFSSTATLMTLEIPGEPMPASMGDAYLLLPGDEPCSHPTCYWQMYRGETDPTLIWDVLMQPITVLSGDQRKQTPVYERPDAASPVIAEVTCVSQGVHVLERGEAWTRIEGYSSSVEGSPVANFAGHFTGYVPTNLLEEKEVNHTYGIVIDKLQQRLWVYKEGALYATLLCSTGFPSEEAPWNETPAGEYIIVSRTGGFWSGNLYCDMALRINDGILLHEVPCQINPEDESRDYSRCERYLGEKASHGCIRIQRKLSPEGVNMQWLWDNLKVGTKVIIWDEVGRELTYPDNDLPLYYNPDNGRQYHANAECLAVRSEYWPLAPFTWGELETEPFHALTPCPACAPQPRMARIDEMNALNTRQP